MSPHERRDLAKRRLGIEVSDEPLDAKMSSAEFERYRATELKLEAKVAARKRERGLAKEHLRRPTPRPVLFTRRTHGTRLRAAPDSRRATTSQGTQSGDSDPHLADGEPPGESGDGPGLAFTFEEFHELTAGLGGAERLRLFLLLDPAVQDAAWDALARDLDGGR